MANKIFKCYTLIVGIFLIFGFSQGIFYKPKILSKYETVLNSGQNYTVTCEGNKPLKWTFPTIDPDENDLIWYDYTTFTVENVIPINNGYEFASNLTITNITFPFTGFYYCHYVNANKNSEMNSTKVYIYVSDDEHLSVSSNELISTIVTQYEEAVIPCRPTSPDVKVTLLSNDDGSEVTLGLINEYHTLYRFHPHYGYFSNDTKQQTTLTYECIYTKNSLTTVQHVIFEVETINQLAKPYLSVISEDHTIGNQLIIQCIVDTLSHNVKFNWQVPSGKIDYSRTTILTPRRNSTGSNWISNDLIINRTTEQDKGTYTCMVYDKQEHQTSASIQVALYAENEHFVHLSEENGIFEIQSKAGEHSVQWRIDVEAHPSPKLTWIDNKNITIPVGDSQKYNTSFSTKQAFLQIKNIDITDFGNYTLIADNGFEVKQLQLFLNVTDKPSIHIETDSFHLINTKCNVKCIVAAYPPPSIQWQFKRCQDDKCNFEPLQEISSSQNGLQFISYAEIYASESGYIKCSANNSLGGDISVAGFYVSDVENGFDIFNIDKTVDLNEEEDVANIALDETLSMTCGASSLNYTNINWYFNNERIQNDNDHVIENSETPYSKRSTLKIPYVQFSHSGKYTCVVFDLNGQKYSKEITYRVSRPSAPSINRTKDDSLIEMNLPDRLKLTCMVNGIPKPTITWYKNEQVFNPENTQHIRVSKDKKIIVFKQTTPNDEANYKCEAFSKLGQASKNISVKFKNIPKNYWYLIIIAVLIVVVAIAGVFIITKIVKERKLENELRKMGLSNFEKGNIENINPELGIDDQAELLPYDRKWEFPIEKLKLGIQLGSGAFGVVMKGEAKNIIEGEESTTVAVKMVKRNADNAFIRALSSELKIMVHLGKHVNVVNLLGACTKNVTKRELLVIVEYCRFGNLHNYLLRHRENFINQVDIKTGKIDFNIGQEILERTYSVSSNRSNNKSPSLKYATLAFSNSNGTPIFSNSMGDYRSNTSGISGTTAKTEMTTLSSQNNSHGDDSLVLSNNSIQPEWRSNYKGDYKDNKVKPICTKDLLAWAFQVARGMEYLASRKVLHGDLAARNILLADNNIVKICDFGLAKSMYKNENYKKKSDGPLPIKWMAIESIRDRVFSTQSDVWSFGIVLWEFFSLAKTPYPGMEPNEQLYHKLVDGYRMECPEYAPKQIYGMMNDCWRATPLSRPTFTKLVNNIGSLLEESVKNYYIELNNPYLVMNTQRIENGQNDYLAMLSPPNFENLSSPHYMNDSVFPPPQYDQTTEDGYLCMKPASIFSPRLEDGEVFTFDANNKKQKSSEEANGLELLPMLQTINELDSERLSHPDCFSNPNYLIPNINSLNKDLSDKQIVKSTDNYIHMPQHESARNLKNNSKTSLAQIPINKSLERHYVNNNSRDWESVIV